MSAEDGQPPKPPPKEDVVFVHSASEAGDAYRVIRKREDAIEIGEIRNIEEGRPIHGEVVKLKPRKDQERLFDVEVLVPREQVRPAALGHPGPAQVASSAYRRNWEAIFGPPEEPELPN